MDNTTLKQLIKEAHENAVRHGFYDGLTIDKPDMPRLLMLIIGEVAEFMEADRKSRWITTGPLNLQIEEDLRSMLDYTDERDTSDTDFKEYYDQNVKGCAEEELADICIRCFDMLGFIRADEVSINHYYPIEERAADYSVTSLCYAMCKELTSCITLQEDSHALTAVIKAIVLWCEEKGVNLMLHIKAKMLYNESRPYKHGKKY